MAALSLTRRGAQVTGELTKDRHNDIVSILGPTPTKGLLSPSSSESILANGQEKEAWVLGAVTPSRQPTNML